MNRRIASRKVPALLVGVLTGALVLGACGDDDENDDASGSPAEREKVTVLAAASLTEVFTELEPIFEEQNPTADLVFSYGGSSDLAQQIVNGAPADVFASANEKQMQVVTDEELTEGRASLFATNVLTIAVPKGNEAGIRSFADLADSSNILVVCAPQVPCGSATATVEKNTGIDLQPDSEEPDVTSVLAKVAAGEADAGLVYVTDVRSTNGGVDSIDFPEAQQAINTYPIATISSGPHQDLGARFVQFVHGPEAQQALRAAGFGAP